MPQGCLLKYSSVFQENERVPGKNHDAELFIMKPNVYISICLSVVAGVIQMGMC